LVNACVVGQYVLLTVTRTANVCERPSAVWDANGTVLRSSSLHINTKPERSDLVWCCPFYTVYKSSFCSNSSHK